MHIKLLYGKSYSLSMYSNTKQQISNVKVTLFTSQKVTGVEFP